MLEDVKQPFTFRHLKHLVFQKFATLVADTQPQLSKTTLTLVVDAVIMTLLYVSIVFQQGLSSLWSSSQVETLVNAFSYLNPPTLYNNAQVDVIIQGSIMAILLLFQLLFLLYLLGVVPTKSMLTVIVFLFRVLRVLSIPIFKVVIFNWFCQKCSSSHSITNPLLTVIFLVFIVLMSFFEKFYYSPFVTNNSVPKLNSDFEVFSLWANLLKVIFYQYHGVTLELVTSILILDAAKLIYVKGWAESRVTFTTKVPTYISVLTCVIILINQMFQGINQGLFNVWLICSCLFLVAMVVKWVREKFQHIRRLYDCTVARDHEIISMSHEFLRLGDWSNLGSGVLTNYLSFLCFHLRKCNRATCYLKSQESSIKKLNVLKIEENNLVLKSHILNFLSDVMLLRSRDSEEVLAMYLVFCYETRQWGGIKNTMAPCESLSYGYVRFMIDEKLKKQDHNEDVNITEETYQLSRAQFFAQFLRVLTSFKHFFNELKAKRPTIDVLNMYGHEAYLNLEDLKKIFLRLLKSDHFDLRVIEVYEEFMINLLKDEELSEYVKRISTQKWSYCGSTLSLESSPVPSIQINPDEDKILNINAESIKILKFHRIDIYDKKIQNFMHPYNSEETLRQFFDRLVVRANFCFLRDASGAMLPVILTARVRMEAEKEVCLLELEPLNRLHEEGFILINDKGQFVEAHPLIFNDKSTQINLKELFHDSISSEVQKLHCSKFLNVHHRGINVHVLICDTIHPSFKFIKIQIKKDIDQTGKPNEDEQEDSSSVGLKEAFQFCPLPDFEKQQLLMQGQFVDCEELSHNYEGFSLDSLVCKSQRLMDVGLRVNYSEGIKSYRLDGEIIYNIELEEKNSSKDIENESNFNFEKPDNQIVKKNKTRVLYFILLAISVVYFGAHVYAIMVKSRLLYNFSIDQSLDTILSFEHKYHRMFGIMRDASLNVTYASNATWTTQMLTLFDSIQNSESTLKFSKNILTMTVLNTTYTTFLDELCNVMLTEMFRMASSGDLTHFLDLNSNSIAIIDPAIAAERDQTQSRNVANLDTYFFMCVAILVIHICLVLIFLGFVLQINNGYRDQKEMVLRPWRILGDEEIQSIVDKIAMYEVLLMLSERSEEVEVYGTLKETTLFNKRDFPKDLSRSSDQRKTYWVATILVLLVLGVGIHGYSIYSAGQNRSNVIHSHKMTVNFPRCYSEVVRLSKLNNIFQNSDVININEMLVELGSSVAMLRSSASSIHQVRNILYKESQNFARFTSQISSLDTFAQGFLYTNPFSMGYLVYLSGMAFELHNNISNVYPCSGVIGKPFTTNIDYFIKSGIQSNSQLFKDIYRYEIGYFMSNTVLCFIIWIVIILLWSTSVVEIRKIEQINKLLTLTSVETVEIRKEGYQAVRESEHNNPKGTQL